MRQKYTTQMSVSDLIDIDYSLLQVISRMGLSLKYAGLLGVRGPPEQRLPIRTHSS